METDDNGCRATRTSRVRKRHFKLQRTIVSASEKPNRTAKKVSKKRAVRDAGQADEALDFEATLSKLESIVEELELGRFGLTKSLEQFETGVQHMKQCYKMLDAAEKRVAILTGNDENGNPQTEPFSEAESESLTEKADNRSRRRTASRPKKTKTESSSAQDNVDAPRGLF